MERKYARMVCLVGENPLPVYLGIRQFAAEGAEIILVHSSGPQGTKNHAKRIIARIQDEEATKPVKRRFRYEPVDDPFSPTHVANVLNSLAPEPELATALNMTGGTKIMAAFSVLAWQHNLNNVIYLAEVNGKFWFGDGTDADLEPHRLHVRDLCSLHDICLQEDTSWKPDPTPEDLQLIFDARKADRLPRFKHGEDFGGEREEQDYQWFQEDRRILDWCLDLITDVTRARWSAFSVPTDARAYAASSWRRVFEFFAKNQWMEYLTRELILCTPRTTGRLVFGERPDDPIVREDDLLFSQDFIVGRPQGGGNYDPKQFEGDVLAVVKNRLRYVSVTTNSAPAACKEKMFEAMHRARQIGGDLASSCVVSLTWRGGVKGCRDSINEHPRHTIYGREDVDDWMKGNPMTLREFLTRDFR